MTALKWLLGLTFITAACLTLQPLYYYAKAELAQVLLQSAWQKTQVAATSQKPWLWADTWPVFKMVVQSETLSQPLTSFIVLADASGESLAFGPGLVSHSMLPGEPGHSMVAAHRDTHFALLQQLKIDDQILIEYPDQSQVQFAIDKIVIVDSRNLQPEVESDETRLTLVTCYPFEPQAEETPFRYLVSAVKI